jgi:hypothetical protein
MSVLEILGQSHDGDSLWISLDGDEFDVTPSELAVARRIEQRGYKQPTLHGRPVDGTQIRTLINAMDASQPYWPPVLCEEGDCGTEAVISIEGRKLCHGHAQGYTAREEGQ